MISIDENIYCLNWKTTTIYNNIILFIHEIILSLSTLLLYKFIIITILTSCFISI